MRIRAFFLFVLMLLLFGCSGDRPAAVEHTETASMASALTLKVYLPDGTGGLTVTEKLLPWETNMELYALSFLPDEFTGNCDLHLSDGTATLNLVSFPLFDSEETECAAIASLVNTMLSLPSIDAIELRFDGQCIDLLENGMFVSEPFTELIDVPITSDSERVGSALP